MHPDALNAQYRLSLEKESTFPFGLNNPRDLQGLIDHFCPLSIRTKTKTGHSSACKPLPTVNIFNIVSNIPDAGSNPTRAGKVHKL